MNSVFNFFETSRREKRQYFTRATPYDEVLRHMARHNAVEVIKDTKMEVEVIGSHLLIPGSTSGVGPINERFNIQLPDDFNQFYQHWGGGYLLFQEIYRLMPVQEIIELTLDMQARKKERKDLPWHLIRFCDLNEVGHLALRLCPDGQWRIMLAETGFLLHQLLYDEEITTTYTWDDSFTLWLRRMCATDGWPCETHVYVPEDPPLIRL